ncbi:low molecular weight phosphatase family protein [Paenimyroides aestuarii]|uniref:Phosphotyrosine protein phosphatase n=1 Tax=Paenimyroides aestuarii TaxID=2968490 RepID=A0ABY5NSX7_9FLAO|nr:phosphotyrosine protein phosphatase [Paenimyroides aestuarii]UUV21589.1 phosphotyrosine protein phosphatase [Paenimyroides aestuarii]
MVQTVLFICSANKQRSKTAEDYFSAKYPNIQFESAGTNLKICKKEGTNLLTINLLKQADLIFVMENNHKKEVDILMNGRLKNEIIVLNIKDIFKYYQRELIEILENKIDHYLE